MENKSCSLADYGIRKKSTLNLLVLIDENEICVKMFTWKAFTVNVEPNDLVLNLK